MMKLDDLKGRFFTRMDELIAELENNNFDVIEYDDVGATLVDEDTDEEFNVTFNIAGTTIQII